jgi:hypothetical protein
MNQALYAHMNNKRKMKKKKKKKISINMLLQKSLHDDEISNDPI